MTTVIEEASFGYALGRRARLFTLKSGEYSVCFTDFGCTLVRFAVPASAGAGRDIVLGYDSAEGYERGSSFIGATVGLYATSKN